MGRKYVRKVGARNYRNYSEEQMRRAIRLVTIKGYTYEDAAQLTSIPRKTIWNKVNRKHQLTPGGQTSLTSVEERHIVDVVLAASEFGSPLTSYDLRHVVKRFLDKSGRQLQKFPDNLPGKEWCLNFIERHKDKLTKRSCQNIKGVRSGKCEDEIMDYFNNLSRSLADIPAANILNFDETNLSDDPGSTKCIFRRGVKYPERIMNSTKTSISIMFAITGAMEVLLPYVVYKAERIYDQWTINGPKNCRYNRSKSGWFDSYTFEDWFVSLVIPWAKKREGPKVIIGDNLSSHLNVDILVKCQQNNIRFVFLPPHSTHLTQPLDVGYYGPLKKKWRKILEDYKVRNPREKTLNKTSFPLLLKRLITELELTNKKNIASAFRATGIIPLDPQQVLKRLHNYRAEQHVAKQVSDTLLEYLKELRSPSTSQEKKVRKKMLKVIPGKSVSYEELQGCDSNEDNPNTNIEHENSETEMFRQGIEDENSEFVIEDEEQLESAAITNDDFIEMEEELPEPEIRIPRVGDFVLVSFSTKKTVKHFVGLIIEVDRPEVVIKFLRKKAQGMFAFPDQDDISLHQEDDILAFLNQPSEKRGIYRFNEDLKQYNL